MRRVRLPQGVPCNGERPLRQAALSREVICVCSFLTSKGYCNKGTLRWVENHFCGYLLALWTSLAKLLEAYIEYLLSKLWELPSGGIPQDKEQ